MQKHQKIIQVLQIKFMQTHVFFWNKRSQFQAEMYIENLNYHMFWKIPSTESSNIFVPKNFCVSEIPKEIKSHHTDFDFIYKNNIIRSGQISQNKQAFAHIQENKMSYP